MMINLHSSQHDYVTVRNVIASSLNKSMLTAKWFSFNGTSKKVLNFTDITNFPYKKNNIVALWQFVIIVFTLLIFHDFYININSKDYIDVNKAFSQLMVENSIFDILNFDA